ncbi:RxLR effector protein [Phytophthora megakarya]|uniref:RxLR effector protein n=1 Tax=Phytophthora megakarya TaxID=4795 RepID=A0A225WVQ5_9STRA|nr:RxLR effector protein [Phytophthora megakarya]
MPPPLDLLVSPGRDEAEATWRWFKLGSQRYPSTTCPRACTSRAPTRLPWDSTCNRHSRVSRAQRKLGIRHFDGKDLYQSLGSGFLTWGKWFVRLSSLRSEAKVDILGHHLTGVAERYYNQQVEGW